MNNLIIVWDWEHATGDAFNICAKLKAYGYEADAANASVAERRREQRYWALLCLEEPPDDVRALAPVAHATDEESLRDVIRTMVEFCITPMRYHTRVASASLSASTILAAVCEQVTRERRQSGLPADQMVFAGQSAN